MSSLNLAQVISGWGVMKPVGGDKSVDAFCGSVVVSDLHLAISSLTRTTYY